MVGAVKSILDLLTVKMGKKQLIALIVELLAISASRYPNRPVWVSPATRVCRCAGTGLWLDVAHDGTILLHLV
jgi:Tfp pilus assembly protein PilZ